LISSTARRRWIVAIALLASIVIVWRARRRAPEYPTAYVANSRVTLWSSNAPVRSAVATVHYGQPVRVITKSGDKVQVRTAQGAQGWMDERLLLDTITWQQAAELIGQAKSIPVQATGHTRATSNVHSEPGRETPRIFQFMRDVRVEVLQRRVVPAAPAGAGSNAESSRRLEDWLFVLAAEPQATPPADSSGAPRATATRFSTSGSGMDRNAEGGTPADTPVAGSVTGPVAGWILARFVVLDPPQPIPEYASSAGMRVVAWAVLNTVPDTSGERPQYLVAGQRGGEGQPCDFSIVRVYTWGIQRQRYETAYVESGICGGLPIRTQRTSDGAEFRFPEADQGKAGGIVSERVYLMKQTVVRRIRQVNGTLPRRVKGK
jgi:hypothetical protein